MAARWHARRASWLAPIERQGLARRVVVEARKRVVLWLGSPSATELGFCLHHVYGLPYLPPSGLKGLASAALWRRTNPEATWEDPPREVLDLFGEGGDHGHVGRVAFLEGIPLGDESGRVTLEVDVMTPHHPGYYAGTEETPHDCEGPNPLPFLCIPPGQRFEIGLVYAREPRNGGRGAAHWLHEAERHLVVGLTEMGLGSKTLSGDGVLVPVAPPASGVSATSSGHAEVVATVIRADRRTAEGMARREDGVEFPFRCSLLASKLNLYKQDWHKAEGRRLVFIFEGDRVVSVREES